MKRARVGVVGATGYSGSLAARILATHPHVDLTFLTSDAKAGRASGIGGLSYSPNAEAESLAKNADVVFLATPAEVSAKLAPKIACLVIDLSGAFRLPNAGDYPKWYGFDHPSPASLASAWYGLPELGLAHPPAKPKLIANPGCYPTATLLALAPLVKAGLVEPSGIIVDAKSGVTGAGRQSKEEYSFSEVDEDVRAYKLLSHQHTPEIIHWLSRASEHAVSLTFTAHLVPLKRGLLATCYARPKGKVTPEDVRACLTKAYENSRFVDVCEPSEVTLSSVVGTNRARVGATANDDVVIAIGSIDNLLKGAAGQAVQNMNVALGVAEDAGLAHLLRSAP